MVLTLTIWLIKKAPQNRWQIKIAAALEAAKRSVKWLSDQSGTPYVTLRRQLSGKASISIGQIAVYADCLRVEPMTMLPDSFIALAGKEEA